MESSRRGLCAQADTTTLNELEGITRVRSHPSLEAEVPLAGGKHHLNQDVGPLATLQRIIAL